MKKQSAFTLVELSIVLVILGLLVGGVLTGQSLIRAAELRAVTTEKDKYIVAFYTFRDKYMAVPGDMPNAYAYWGSDCGTDTTTGNTGCNGNGDGYIDIDLSMGESVKAWEHLSRAGLIEGSFTGEGIVDAGSIFLSPTAIPHSKLTNAFWNFGSGGNDASGALTLPNMQLNFIGLDPATGRWIALPSLTNGEALSIDLKTDDGHANSGNLRGDGGDGCDDDGTDYYRLIATGANNKGHRLLHFLVN